MSGSTDTEVRGLWAASLVLEMDPAAPPDSQAVVLLADPPFRLVCSDPDCSRPQMIT